MDKWTDELLLQHAHLVKSVFVTLTDEWFYDEYHADPYKMKKYDNLTMYESEESSVRYSGQRRGLSPSGLINILVMCPHLEKLEVTIPKPSDEVGVVGLENIEQNLSHMVRRLIGLKTLKLVNHSFLRLSEISVIEMIENLPLLEFFDCLRIGSSETEDHFTGPPLEHYLSRLRNLSFLSVQNHFGRDRAWSLQPWTAPIRTLQLGYCSNLSVTDAYHLINSFRPQLTKLTLLFGSNTDNRIPTPTTDCQFGLTWAIENRFKLPMLKTLHLENPTPWNMLSSFEDCKALSSVHYVGLPVHEWSSVVELVCNSAWPQLKYLYLQDPQVYSTIDWDITAGLLKLRKFCLDHKIEFYHGSDDDDD